MDHRRLRRRNEPRVHGAALPSRPLRRGAARAAPSASSAAIAQGRGVTLDGVRSRGVHALSAAARRSAMSTLVLALHRLPHHQPHRRRRRRPAPALLGRAAADGRAASVRSAAASAAAASAAAAADSAAASAALAAAGAAAAAAAPVGRMLHMTIMTRRTLLQDCVGRSPYARCRSPAVRTTRSSSRKKRSRRSGPRSKTSCSGATT